MAERLTVHQKFYLQQVRAAEARSLEAEFDRQAQAHNVVGVVPEYVFHPTRKWRLDRAIPSLKVCAEMHGGIWRPGGGAHSRPAAIERDIEKANALQELGWLCAYITEKMLKDGSGIALFKRFAERRQAGEI